MSDISKIKANWETLSTRTISCVFVDPGAAIPVIDILGHNLHWIPEVHRPIYQAILECVESDTPVAPNTANVSTKGGGSKDTDLVVLEAIANTWTDQASRDLIQNTNALKALGLMFELRSIGDTLGRVTKPDDVANLIAYTEVALQSVTANRTLRDASAKAASEAAWEFKGHPIKTGLQWFDDLAGGYWTHMITWIAARYKGGKSTVMRNFAKEAAQAGVPIDIFIAEGSREGLALDFQVMLAVEWLLRQGHDVNEISLSKLKVTRSIVTPGEIQLEPVEKEALSMARADFETWPVRIWDAQDGIHNLVNLVYKARISRLEHGTEAIYIDYAQLLSTPGVTGIYEQATNTAVTLQKLAAKEGIAVVAIAQKNERGVTETNTLDGSYSPRISGGGSAASTADFLFQPNITKIGTLINALMLPLTHSRHTPTGRGAHAIHPGSGLICDKYTSFTQFDLQEMTETAVEEGEQFVQFGG